jgi:hypothetical protein
MTQPAATAWSSAGTPRNGFFQSDGMQCCTRPAVPWIHMIVGRGPAGFLVDVRTVATAVAGLPLEKDVE